MTHEGDNELDDPLDDHTEAADPRDFIDGLDANDDDHTVIRRPEPPAPKNPGNETTVTFHTDDDHTEIRPPEPPTPKNPGNETTATFHTDDDHTEIRRPTVDAALGPVRTWTPDTPVEPERPPPSELESESDLEHEAELETVHTIGDTTGRLSNLPADPTPTVGPDPASPEQPAGPSPAPVLEQFGPASSDDPAGAAAAFVREARERQAQLEAPAAEPERKRHLGLLVLAVIVAAQIVAGGTWLALRALDGDDREIAEPTPEPTLAPLEPTALPTPVVGATSLPTPTMVPPTPGWQPVEGGPRLSPFTWITEAIVREPRFFDAPGGDEIEPEVDGVALALVNPRADGDPLVLRVRSGQPDLEWAEVELPGGGSAWILSEEFVWRSINRLVQIDVSTNLLTVYEGNAALVIVPVASGRRDEPTQPLTTWIFDQVPDDGGAVGGGSGSDVVFRLAALDDVAPDADGYTTARIRITDDRAVIGEYSTGGEILLSSDRLDQILRLVEPGTRVDIVGSPTRPTPTPVPTPTPRPPSSALGDGSGGGAGSLDPRCPGGASGSPPNCYRVVEREQLPAPCPGNEVVINNQCMTLAGDPELNDDGGESCPATAPTVIDGFCYQARGPVPTRPGPCPDGSTEVGDECRVPVG